MEDYSEGVVYRHEHTLAGPKKDRMEVLKATRAHFGQLFMLYPDPAGQIDGMLRQIEQNEPGAVVTDEYHAVHRVWNITDPETVRAFQAAMWDKKLLIADGHHRYETALAFRDDHPELADARWVMMTLVSMHSEGLQILATHRVLRNFPSFDAAAFFERAGMRFRVSRLDSLQALKDRWAQAHPGVAQIGVAVADEFRLLETERSGKLDLEPAA